MLLIRHTYGDRRWHFPGGMVRRGESAEEAARRETREEVALALSSLTPIGEFTTRDKLMRDHVSCFHSVSAGSAVRPHRGEVREAKWFAWGALPEDLSPDALRVLERYGESVRAGRVSGAPRPPPT